MQKLSEKKMSQNNHFVDKLIDRLEKVDKETLKQHVYDLSLENSKFKTLLNQASEGIIAITKIGKILFINEAVTNILGLPKGEYKNLEDIEKVSSSHVTEFIKETLENSTSNITEDISTLEPKEQTVRVSISKTPGTNDPEEYFVLLSDKTQEISHINWLHKINRIQSLVKLAAGIAHEIGNPLNSIGIHLQLLGKEIEKLPKNTQQKFEEKVEILKTETARLDKIIRDFLKATRKPPIRFKEDDLNATLEDALKVMLPELKSHKIDATLNKDEYLPRFMFDRERLHQAFINIIKNAFEATSDNGGKLAIHVSHKDKVTSIAFEDEGSGISDEDLPHIFDAYYTTKEEGSGLGLMTVMDAIQDHGGRIDVKSKLGEGTTITLMLPIRHPKLQIANE